MTESLRYIPNISEKRSRLMAALSYLGILCFIPLLFSRDDQFVNFHSRQGLIIWMWGIIAIYAYQIPGLGWFSALSASIIPILSLIGMASAVLLQTWKFPIINNIADKLLL